MFGVGSKKDDYKYSYSKPISSTGASNYSYKGYNPTSSYSYMRGPTWQREDSKDSKFATYKSTYV